MHVADASPPPLPSRRRGIGCLGWGLIGVVTCVVLCGGLVALGVRWFGNAFTADPARVGQITAKIADFAPPETLRPFMGLDLDLVVAKCQVAGYISEAGMPLVMLMQFQGMSEEDARTRLDEVGGNAKDFTPLSTTEEPVTIRGAEVPAVVQKGTFTTQDDAGKPQKFPAVRAVAEFTGRGGRAMVMVLVAGDGDDEVGLALELVELVR